MARPPGRSDLHTRGQRRLEDGIWNERQGEPCQVESVSVGECLRADLAQGDSVLETRLGYILPGELECRSEWVHADDVQSWPGAANGDRQGGDAHTNVEKCRVGPLERVTRPAASV